MQTLDGNALETSNLKLREHFKSGDVLKILALLEYLRLYRRGASRIQLLLNHSFIEGGLDQITQRFLTSSIFITLTNNAHRHFTRTEAWHLGAASSLLQTLVDFGLDTLSRDTNGHAALKSGGAFNRNLHGFSSLHRRRRPFWPQNQGHTF